MDSNDNGLVKLLEGCGLKSKAVTRIQNAVRKIPDSVSYKALHNTKISMVCTEEIEAAKNIENESEKITNAITNITNIINRLNANSKDSENIINNTFDNIIININKRRNILLKELKNVTNNKQNELLAQKNEFNEKAIQLNIIYSEIQYMMKDTTIDINKRKIKILSNSKQILDQNIELIANTNDKIQIDLKVNKLNEIISTFGMIMDGNCVLILYKRMDPLDCTLDELADNNRKRRRNNNNYNNTNYNTHNTSPQKRFKGNHYNSKPYNNYNNNYNTYNNYNKPNYNRNRNNYNNNRNRNRNNYNQNRNRNRFNNNNNSNSNYYPRNQKKINSAPLPPPPSNNYYITQTETETETETKTENENNNEPKYGYVTLIMRGDNYIPGALILGHSLRLVNTKHSLIAMITNDISTKAKEALNLLYDYVIEVPYIKYKCKPMKTEKQKEKYSSWADDSFTKWNILQLNKLLNISFNKLLFLDCDKIIIKNIDKLFTNPNIQCPAGTFSSPWTNKKSNKGLIDYYPHNISHGDIIPAKSIYNALYKNGFVAVGTCMLFKPNIKHYEKFIKMLENKWICNEYIDNDIDKEKIKLRKLNKKFAVNNVENKEKNEPNIEHKKSDICDELSDKLIGFSNCYSMLDEQSTVYFYYYHRIAWNYISTKYNFIPWHFKWLENESGKLDIPVILHFFGMKPWNLSPLEWKDLQVWWGLVFNLVNYACDDMYKWNENNKKMISSFFKLNLINELPLDLFIEKDVNDGGDNGKDFETESGDVDKELKSKVVCFWCYEIAKRQGLGVAELIKNNDFEKIDWIFHCPIDPLTGKLCCEKLLADKSKY